ncbi:MAG: NYN domain-containing protein [Acidobacteria bacterium]|jgi:uncharacterized protein (TIGR00288 family)|nr:NYN domain-containing protein [Acidobacteriota bacterium]
MPDEQLRIAVFIDFDNIEIGVRSTMNKDFDVGSVLEALKERGEVISKIAYGNWKRHGNASRMMSEQAVQMVQRDPTPRGDKNGADINLALDALEMAFTKPHINAYAIVGGDSDFIALVEKLKQYNKAVFVVGGRGFTSAILQKNCREFISYENVVREPEPRRQQQAARRPARRGELLPLEGVVPLLERALRLLAEREHQPLLGLVKSTMLQLDSTFSERDYGSGSFLDFAQKLAHARLVDVARIDSNYAVKLPERLHLAETPRLAAKATAVGQPGAPGGEGAEAAAETAAATGEQAAPAQAGAVRRSRRGRRGTPRKAAVPARPEPEREAPEAAAPLEVAAAEDPQPSAGPAPPPSEAAPPAAARRSPAHRRRRKP